MSIVCARTVYAAYPLSEIPDVAGTHVQQRDEMRVERHVQHTRVLLVERCNDRLGHVHGHEAREEEPVQERGRVPDGREERCQHMSGDDKCCADARRVVYMVEFIPQGFMQRDQRSLGSVVVGCGKFSLVLNPSEIS